MSWESNSISAELTDWFAELADWFAELAEWFAEAVIRAACCISALADWKLPSRKWVLLLVR